MQNIRDKAEGHRQGSGLEIRKVTDKAEGHRRYRQRVRDKAEGKRQGRRSQTW